MSTKNNLDFILIDFEYAGWNPMAMDVAVFINETMNDNSYPGKNGVEWYLDNVMSLREQDEFIEAYLRHYFANYAPAELRVEYSENVSTFLAANFCQFKKQVLDCALLNNFFWGVWALSLLSEEEFLKEGIFNFDFAHSRCDMYATFCQIIKRAEEQERIENLSAYVLEGGGI
mmetsp:Transcript_9303/g.15679  ORF Transcript_9303/g.15679 Transcript_9303/m.15679 type:complete len:173 (-) Transcript_9303:44-562(-)